MSDEKSASHVAYELVQEAYNKFQDENYTAALQLCQAALAIYEGIGDTTGVAYTLTNIGNIYRRQAVESYPEALLTFREHSIQISEEIAQSISSPLETQINWYVSNNGNAEILKPTDFGSYIGDGQPRFPVNAKGEGQPRSDRPVNKGAGQAWSDDPPLYMGDGQHMGDGQPGSDRPVNKGAGQAWSDDRPVNKGAGQAWSDDRPVNMGDGQPGSDDPPKTNGEGQP